MFHSRHTRCLGSLSLTHSWNHFSQKKSCKQERCSHPAPEHSRSYSVPTLWFPTPPPSTLEVSYLERRKRRTWSLGTGPYPWFNPNPIPSLASSHHYNRLQLCITLTCTIHAGDWPRDGGRYLHIPAKIHEGRPVQPHGPRLLRRGHGVLRRLLVRRSAWDGRLFFCRL